MRAPAKLLKWATGQRALVTESHALRLHPDRCGPEQKATQWLPITPEQRARLLNEARRSEDVEYDATESERYGRPIWF